MKLKITKSGFLYYVKADIGYDDWWIVDSFLTKRGAKKFCNYLINDHQETYDDKPIKQKEKIIAEYEG